MYEEHTNLNEQFFVPKRILHVISGLGTGGAERMLVKLLGFMNLGRGEHFVISLRPGGSQLEALSRANVTVFPINMGSPLSVLYKLPRLISITRRIRPDLIQGWMYHGNIAASLASLSLYPHPRPPVLWNIRHTVYHLKYEKFATRIVIWLNAILSPLANRIIYNSSVSRFQHETLGFRRNAEKLPNGFALEKFRPDPFARSRLIDELDLDPDAIIVGNVARFHPMKDHRTLLEAGARVVLENNLAHLVLVGPGINSANLVLKHQIKRFNLNGRLHLLGERSDVERILPAFDVFVLSSAWGESFPNVLGEAMACGVPCVATDIGECATILGKQGAIVRPRSPSQLADEILRLLKMSKPRRQAMGNEARQRISTYYSLNRVAEGYETICSSL